MRRTLRNTLCRRNKSLRTKRSNTLRRRNKSLRKSLRNRKKGGNYTQQTTTSVNGIPVTNKALISTPTGTRTLKEFTDMVNNPDTDDFN